MNEPIAVFDQVSYMYPQSPEPVLRNISLQVAKGEFLGIVGPTGAGKSTLCLAFNGIVPQFFGGRFFGSVTVAGLDTLEHPISHMARHVGAVFEDPETQLISTSVENEIAFTLENVKLPREAIRERIGPALAAVRLSGMEKKSPHELSGGQKQRLAIAAALALRPALLVLDEPTSQLDPVGAQEVFATVRELNRELGVTIVMATHAAEELAEYADRIAMLSGGELVAIGTPREIYGDVARLEAHALRPPQVAATFYAIGQRGLPVPRVPVRLAEGQTDLINLARDCPPAPPRNLPAATVHVGAPLLAAQHLVHRYPDGTEALHGVDIEIREGEYVLIVGQNGAGKSTLVKHFLRLLEPTSGAVAVGGVDTRTLQMSDLARRIGYVAQNPDNQIFNTSVAEEVAFALKNLGHAQGEVAGRTEECLRSMGLWEQRDRHPLSLPRGDRARVVIAAILAMRPEIIIFDEPTTGQDYRGAAYILDLSRELHRLGKTVVVITHHLYLMPDYAERVIVMGKGTVLLDAPIRPAYHAVDLLQSTFLTPPQAVLLARELSALQGMGFPLAMDFPLAMNFPLLTPAELAQCFVPEPATLPGGLQ